MESKSTAKETLFRFLRTRPEQTMASAESRQGEQQQQHQQVPVYLPRVKLTDSLTD